MVNIVAASHEARSQAVFAEEEAWEKGEERRREKLLGRRGQAAQVDNFKPLGFVHFQIGADNRIMADEKKALEGHRRAVREHIAKWEHYSLPHEKHFAYKTIQNAQTQIAKILKRHRHWLPGWEDHWIPGQPHPEITDWMPDD